MTLWSDGGGRVPAAWHPVSGRDTVAKFLLSQVRRNHDLTITVEQVNRKATIVGRRLNGDVEDVVDLVSDAGKIVAIYAVRNPAKLQRLSS